MHFTAPEQWVGKQNCILYRKERKFLERKGATLITSLKFRFYLWVSKRFWAQKGRQCRLDSCGNWNFPIMPQNLRVLRAFKSPEMCWKCQEKNVCDLWSSDSWKKTTLTSRVRGKNGEKFGSQKMAQIFQRKIRWEFFAGSCQTFILQHHHYCIESLNCQRWLL